MLNKGTADDKIEIYVPIKATLKDFFFKKKKLAEKKEKQKKFLTINLHTIQALVFRIWKEK